MVGLFGRVGQWVLGGMLTGVVGVGPVVAAPGGAVGGAPVVGGGKVAGAPVVGGAVLVKGDRRSWVDVAGDEAKRAHELEQKGLKGEAERARERVLHALVLAWREERAVEVLEPIVSTLHRRLGRSAAAVGVALRFIYEIHEVDALSELQQAQIVALQGQVVLALERLRREAKPRDGADCGLGFGGGVVVLEGPLVGDPVLVVRDVAGGVSVVECAGGVGSEERGGGGERGVGEGDEPWWLMGGGLVMMATGGVLLGLHLDWASQADELHDRGFEGDLSIAERIKQNESTGRADAYATAGIVTLGVGAGLALGGLAWGLLREGSADETTALRVGPDGVVFSGRF